jgi:hypothetical protein
LGAVPGDEDGGGWAQYAEQGEHLKVPQASLTG